MDNYIETKNEVIVWGIQIKKEDIETATYCLDNINYYKFIENELNEIKRALKSLNLEQLVQNEIKKHNTQQLEKYGIPF